MLPPTAYEARNKINWGWWRFAAVWTLVAVVVLGCCAVGSIFGWVKYFEDDGFAPQFALANAQNAALQEAINEETAARKSADANLTVALAATLAAVDAEIATRTAEDALLLAMINAEIANRTAAQQLLNVSIGIEIANRTAFDELAFAELANLTARLAILTAYDVYAQSLFVGIYNNLTLLQIELFNETAARIAAENILFAQDLAQQNFIALFAAELAAEISTRTTEGEIQLAEIAAFLGNGILTINNQSSLNHNFQFVSANAGFTIGSGGTNIVTITDDAISTVDSVTPAPVTFDISILADSNVVMTPGVNSLTFGLAVVPPPLNYASYRGSWAASTSGDCIIVGGHWYFDAFNLAGFTICTAASPFITNYNTPQGDGYGWRVPTSGGVGYGVWLVRVSLTLTVNYLGTPFGVAFSMGICINTQTTCIATPSANEPQSAFVWQMFTPVATADFAGWGMNYQDHAMKTTFVYDGRGAAAGTGLFPVWQNWQDPGVFGDETISNAFLYAIAVEYDVTQLA